MIELRQYQDRGVTDIRQAYRQGRKSIAYILGTGGGKTVIFTYIAHGATAKSNRITILVHRQELIRQTANALIKMGVEFGVIAAGHLPQPSKTVQLAMVQTLANRIDNIPHPDLLIIDEFHHAVADSYRTVMLRYPKAKILGLTATPQRLDGKGLGSICEELILGPSVQYLIDNKYLAQPIYYAPPVGLDMTNVKKTAGDFNKKQVGERVDRPTITGSAVEHYARICPGVPAIVFCANIKHSENVRDRFNAAGFKAASIDGKLSDDDREKRVTDLASGEISVLTSVDVVSEGFDLPMVTAGIMLRPTDSLALCLQQMGRVLRPKPGKNCIASGMRILTQRGLVNIENILPCDLIWDGHDFVSHGGLINQGVRDVITYEGLTATPDHLVKTKKGWRTFRECAEEQIEIIATGRGGQAIRECENNFGSCNQERFQMENSHLCEMPMREMPQDFTHNVEQSLRRKDSGMPSLQSACEISEMALSEMPRNAGAMHQPETQRVYKLWRARNKVPVPRPISCGHLDKDEYRNKGTQNAVRQDRKQWALRGGEYAMVNSEAEQLPQENNQTLCEVSQVQERSFGSTLCRRNYVRILSLRSDRRTDHKKVLPIIPKKKDRVWDIYCCGPRNSFTVENKLVHNCSIILDHVGNIMRHGLAEEPREWSLNGHAEKAKKTAQFQVPLGTCPECFAVHPSAPVCPQCGHQYPFQERMIEEVKGTLKEITAEDIAAEREKVMKRVEVARAETKQELEAIAKARGYKPSWVSMQLWMRRKKQLSAPIDNQTKLFA